MKDCGSCIHFTKWSDGGLCEKDDQRTKSDHGRKCKDHKRKKYKRRKD